MINGESIKWIAGQRDNSKAITINARILTGDVAKEYGYAYRVLRSTLTIARGAVEVALARPKPLMSVDATSLESDVSRPHHNLFISNAHSGVLVCVGREIMIPMVQTMLLSFRT